MPTSPNPTTPRRILVIEDDPSISDVVSTALRFQGHSVTQVVNGRDGLELATSAPVDLIVLDVMLPGLDGFEVCRHLRERGSITPVLFLTAREHTRDRIRGFATGGDDYLTKPFSIDELVLRVVAILRRTGPEDPAGLLRVGSLTLDPAGREVRRAGVLVDLSATEHRLLEYLMDNRGVVLSKAQILAAVWSHDSEGTENVVELYVGYLRRKLDDGHPRLIHTRRGLGYVLREEPR